MKNRGLSHLATPWQLDVPDAPAALTLKTVSVLKALHLREAGDATWKAEFVLLADDDTFVNLPALLKVLREIRSHVGNSGEIWGDPRDGDTRVLRPQALAIEGVHKQHF